MKLNKEQEKAIYCDENAVVAAGAGSGKTLVLATRFVRLITEKGYNIDEILTLTFTKKAAAQMYSRIYSLISAAAKNGKELETKRAQNALDNFIHARIQTLDSYGTSLVKQCANRYGIRPDFQIDNERCHVISLEVSYPFLLSHRQHPAIMQIYHNKQPNIIVSDIFSDLLYKYCTIDKPKDFIIDLKKQFCIVCSNWNNIRDELNGILCDIKSYKDDYEKYYKDIIPVMETYEKENMEIPAELLIRGYFDELLELNADLYIEKAQSHELQKKLIKILNFFMIINSLDLRRGKKSDNPIKENIKKIRNITGTFSSIIIFCMQAGFNLSFASLLMELQNIYIDKKRREGVLTFKDVANLSRTILLEQKDIRAAEKESFKAIMIDEFQDNNELQKDLLFLLAEKPEITKDDIPSFKDICPDKLFFVGDEKQSVYLFRGADVSVFRTLRDELKALDLQLTVNYRSDPNLINAFNAIFPYVFASSNFLPVYEAEYKSLKAASSKNEGNLTFCIYNKFNSANNDDDILSSDESEARFTAEKIKDLLQQYKPHEIAVLLRTRTRQHLYEKHLRLLGIPYSCEDINDLFYAGPVNDIMSVLRLVAYPIDSSSYAEMLRSPFAGLSLSGTAVCLSFYMEDNIPFSDKPLEHLEQDDKEKYLHGQDIYFKLTKMSEKESISSLLSHLWYNEGYRYETEWNPQVSVYSELFDYLFHLAVLADSENRGLASFTDSIISIRDSGKQLKEMELPLERESAVHLMTIHKSKGLEFPVVFICDCGTKSKPDTPEFVYSSKDAGIVFSAVVPLELKDSAGKQSNFFYQKAKDEMKHKRTAELRRLLYVAMTRAEKQLYLTGSLNIKNEENNNLKLAIIDYVQKKNEKNENYIEGDCIFDNDTFYGMLLPSIASLYSAGNNRLFDIEEIKSYSEEEIKKQKVKPADLSNDQISLNKFIKKVQPLYNNTKVIKTKVLHDNHKMPVSLKENGLSTDEIANKTSVFNRDFSGEDCADIFCTVDALLSRLSKEAAEDSERFNSGSFGTIAHICVEANFNEEKPVIPSNIACFLNEKEMDSLLNAGSSIAQRFILSPLGKIAKKAALRESEFPFRSILKNTNQEEVFINGTIDLFFSDTDCIHIVDFKTDSKEIPAEHTVQLTCYYNAVNNLFAKPEKKPCRVWLYYLRTGHAVEMTERVLNCNLEQKAFSL